jgi:hypothetical protein
MVPTALEFFMKQKKYTNIEQFMIEFAKLHVAEARKQFKIVFSEIDDVYPFMRDDKLSDVYPLTNIK